MKKKKKFNKILVGIVCCVLGISAIFMLGKGIFFANVNDLNGDQTEQNITNNDNDIHYASYDAEIVQAYNYAYSHGLINASNIDEADMFGYFSKIELANIMVKYSTNVLGLAPNYNTQCNFDDVSVAFDAQYEYAISRACQLGILKDFNFSGNFNPSEIATRDFFGTLFSRALNLAKGNDISALDNMDPYYIGHLNYLRDLGIMSNINNPSQAEVRGYVILMLMRADENATVAEGCTAEELLACIAGDNYDECVASCGSNSTANQENYDAELVQAYNYAYSHGLTNATDIYSAGMYSSLSRYDLIKIITTYSMHVLGLTGTTTNQCNFSDIANMPSSRYIAIQYACDLGILKDSDFENVINPNGPATRDFFGTLFSRALNLAKGNDISALDSMNPYYIGHLNYLRDLGIISNINNPTQIETRGYIFLMLMRADENATVVEGCTAEELLACIAGDNYDECVASCGGVNESDNENGGNLPNTENGQNISNFSSTKIKDNTSKVQNKIVNKK